MMTPEQKRQRIHFGEDPEMVVLKILRDVPAVTWTLAEQMQPSRKRDVLTKFTFDMADRVNNLIDEMDGVEDEPEPDELARVTKVL